MVAGRAAVEIEALSQTAGRGWTVLAEQADDLDTVGAQVIPQAAGPALT